MCFLPNPVLSTDCFIYPHASTAPSWPLSESVSLPDLLFLRIALVILDLLYFHINFIISLSNLYKSSWDLARGWAEQSGEYSHLDSIKLQNSWIRTVFLFVEVFSDFMDCLPISECHPVVLLLNLSLDSLLFCCHFCMYWEFCFVFMTWYLV